MSAVGKRTVAATTVAVALLAGRRRLLHWGASPREVAAGLPGDDLVPEPDLVATRAITVRTRPGDVWPWVVQLGQNRGGFYTYDRLENLVGAQIHSADRIVPAWQHVTVGDEVTLAPDVPLAVAIADPPRALVLGGGIPMGDEGPPFDFSWSFVLVEQDDATRLLVRERYRATRWWAPPLLEALAVVSFVMSQRMLRGIRDRAERQPGEPTPQPS